MVHLRALVARQHSHTCVPAQNRFVVPGRPLKSKLLIHPLAEEAGGDEFHGGGHHWKSQDDPEWQTLAAWVRGEKLER